MARRKSIGYNRSLVFFMGSMFKFLIQEINKWKILKFTLSYKNVV
jgi:hypothetical protein